MLTEGLDIIIPKHLVKQIIKERSAAQVTKERSKVIRKVVIMQRTMDLDGEGNEKPSEYDGKDTSRNRESAALIYSHISLALGFER